MANSADPDQLASTDLDLHCLQMQGVSGFSRTMVKRQLYSHGMFLLSLSSSTRSAAEASHREHDRFLLLSKTALVREVW